jgi:hypothetical protein
MTEAVVTERHPKMPMPLVSATSDSPTGGSSAGVRVRVRARVPATLRDAKGLTAARRIYAAALADARRWWLVAAEPPSLAGWLAGQRPADRRVPDGNLLIRGAWVAHNWTVGLLLTGVSVVALLVGGGLRWLAGHPLRFWVAFAMAFAAVTWAVFR